MATVSPLDFDPSDLIARITAEMEEVFGLIQRPIEAPPAWLAAGRAGETLPEPPTPPAPQPI